MTQPEEWKIALNKEIIENAKEIANYWVKSFKILKEAQNYIFIQKFTTIKQLIPLKI